MHKGTQEIWRKCGEQSLMGCWVYRLRSVGGVVQSSQRAASSWRGTTNRQLPFGLTEQLLERGKFSNTITTVRSLGEGALGG